jgi:hypothetical protein
LIKARGVPTKSTAFRVKLSKGEVILRSNFAEAAKKLTPVYLPNLKLLPWWQRLQFEKSFGPNALLPLWHPPQLMLFAGAKCMDASGAETCRPRAAPAFTEWQLVQLRRPPCVCLAWLKLRLNALALVVVQLRRPG